MIAMSRARIGAAALLFLAGCTMSAPPKPGRSPDDRISIMSGVSKRGELEVAIRHDGAILIGPSPVALEFADRPIGPLTEIGRIESPVRKTRSGRGRCRGNVVVARERENARRIIRLETVACDDGAAFRLVVPPQPGITRVRISGETTRFAVPRDDSCLGVRHRKYFNSHEGDYRPVRLRTIAVGDLYDLPLTCTTGRGGETYALTESGIDDYAAAYLTGTPDRSAIAIRLTPRPDNDAIAVSGPMPKAGIVTPWRVVMIADRPERMIENRLVQDLAAASRIGDTSWVRPGKAAWGWWSGLLAPSVPHAGHNMATYRRYIDFAARLGLPYYVIDEGWAAGATRKGGSADVLQSAPGIDVPSLVAYARARGVRLWLWSDWKSLDHRMDAVLARWQQWGVAGLKIDFIYRQDQDVVAYYHRLLANAARHRLLVNIHAAFVPRGLERTYPNFLTEEGVMGNEYNRWSRKVTAGYDVRIAYSRGTIGPMDYTPGGFRNVLPSAFSPKARSPEVMTTRAQQLALFVIYPSPLAVLADAPVAYGDGHGGWAPGTEFLREVPTIWDETRGIAGAFGQWIAVARRRGDRWYVGAITDERARSISLPLSFLGNGSWHVRAWLDGRSPPDLDRRAGTLGPAQNLVIPLAASGGAVLVFERPAPKA